MNCKKCGSLLPVGATSCPVCNEPVEINGTSVESVNANTTVTQVENNPAVPVENNVVETPVVETPVSAVESNVQSTPVESPEVAPVAPEVTSSSADAPIVNNSINPNGTSYDGGLIGNTTPTEVPVNPNKKKKTIIIAVVAIVLVLLIGLGVLFYMYEFKSADSRIQAIYDNLTSFANNVSNDDVELSSGSYDIDASFTLEDETYTASLNGKYGIDLENKIIDYTINLNKLNVGEDLIDEPLSLELFLNDSKIYVLLENFYDKYIYTESEEVQQIFDAIEQNDINYSNITKALRVAVAEGIKAMSTTQSIETVSIGGDSKKANVVRITMTAKNEQLFVNAVVKSLRNNKNFISEMAKVTGYDEDSVKELLNLSNYDLEFTGVDGLKFEIYTSLFKSDYLGAKILYTADGEKDVLETVPVTNGNKYTLSIAGQKVLELNLTSTEKKNSTNTEVNTGISGNLLVSEEAIKFEVNVKETKDVNPKVEKVNVKNSVNAENISAEDKKTITEKIKNFGGLGVLLSPYLNVEDELDESLITSVYCSQAVRCDSPVTEDATSTVCYYCADENDTECNQTITCPLEN